MQQTNALLITLGISPRPWFLNWRPEKWELPMAPLMFNGKPLAEFKHYQDIAPDLYATLNNRGARDTSTLKEISKNYSRHQRKKFAGPSRRGATRPCRLILLVRR